MTLKPSKSHLLRKELDVLGYIVTRDGIKADPEKVHALDQMPDCLQTKKQSEWPWKSDATVETCRYKRAYETVRESLRMDVMLAHPDLHDPLADYVITTDVSDAAASALLMQRQKRQ
eukprot:6209501-Pleurochrysis_carterae.AAC.1